MRLSISFSMLAVALSIPSRTQGKLVFSHYMVGTVTQAHAEQDINDAKAMGLDGFALNVGDATQPFVYDALAYLFKHAETRGDFSLYISMDVYASGAACYRGSPSCHGPYDYQWIWDAHKTSPAYFHYNNLPVISTFSSGGFNNTQWIAWKSSMANDTYFWPDFDETTGYYGDLSGWWWYWGDVCDGLFSWESSWPLRAGFGGKHPGDVSPDVAVIQGARGHNKGYMMGLSSLQYKNSYGENVYREGGETLPARMENILAMGLKDQSPDIVQVITWNDGPESHYIGNLWLEQNNDSQPWTYANQYDWDHRGWQPLITSFIDAYKTGQQSNNMKPPKGSVAVGAMWYKSILTESIACVFEDDGNTQNYYSPPDGFYNGTNSLYWSVVMDPEVANGYPPYTLDLYSGGNLVDTRVVAGGLQYGWSLEPIVSGQQMIQLKDPAGKVIMTASGGLCVADGCPDGIYNSNYQVAPLIEGSTVQACSIDRHDEDGNAELKLCDWDDSRPECMESSLCDLSLTFANLDDLQAASSSLASYCVDIYTLQVVADMLDTALANYEDVNNGYDGKFGYYVKYVKEIVPTQIAEFMETKNGPGNQYFTCTWNENGRNTTTRQCPFDEFSLEDDYYTIYYTLNDSDGFFNLLMSTYGIDSTWVKFGEHIRQVTCSGPNCERMRQIEEGLPLAADNIDVPNPKDIVASALPHIQDLRANILATRLDILLGQWQGSNDDVVQVISMPIFMLVQAVASMAQVKDIGAGIQEEEKKNLILTILSVVLMFVPFLGEAADAATGLAALGRIISLIGDAGNAGLSIVDIIQDPKAAPMAIMGVLLGGTPFRTEEGFADMAGLRRGMGADDIAKIGSSFKTNDGKLQAIVKACSK